MEGSESNRIRSKRDVEENVEVRSKEDYDDREGTDKKKHKSSKSRKHADAEEVDEQDSGRRKASDDRNESKKRSGASSGIGSGDEDDYSVRKEPRLKIPRKDADERIDRRPSDSYRDREPDSSRKRRDDGYEWDPSRKPSSKASAHDSSDNKSRNKAESSYDDENEKLHERDSRYPERKDSDKEKKDQVQNEHERNTYRRRWDEVEVVTKRADEGSHTDRSDSRLRKASDSNKHDLQVDIETDFRNDSGEGKSKVLDSSGDKGSRSSNRDDRKDGSERGRNWNRLEVQDEENRMTDGPHESRSNAVRDDRQIKVSDRATGPTEDVEQGSHRYSSKQHSEKGDKQRQERDFDHGNRDEVVTWEKATNMDEDNHSQMRGTSTRNADRYKQSRSPERTGRHYREYEEHDRGFSDSDNEKSISIKGSLTDRNREREVFKDHWKRIQGRQDPIDGDDFGQVKEWEIHSHEQERFGSENIQIRSGYRKDNRTRSEGARGSSTFSNRNENSDSIEIRPNRNLDFGKDDSLSTFPGRKAEVGSQQDFASGGSDEEWGYLAEDKGKTASAYGDDSQERFLDDGSPVEQSSGRNSFDSQTGKGWNHKASMNISRAGAGHSSSDNIQSYGNSQVTGPFNRGLQQGPKGGKSARGGRGRLNGRDSQRVGPPSSMMGPPFAPLGMPPGPMQPIGPNMTAPPPIGPGVIIPPFPSPLVWPGARGVDMNMLAPPPNLPHIPSLGPARPRFPPNMGIGPGHSMYFNQAGTVRGVPPNISAPGFNTAGPASHDMQHDKAPGGWAPPRTSGPSGKAPSRGEQNDYSQNFVDTGMRPQNFIRELELTSVVEDYPKLRELIQRKDEIVAKSASTPMYYKCDLRDHVLSPEFFGTKFDVILVDPPWEEYVHRAPGITDHLEYWTFEQIRDLKIEAIADTPSFIFLWVGDGVGLEQGRQCLKKWGFRRCEDICWVKTNKKNATPGLRHDSHTLFQHSKEHCLMGIKGTVRRSTDGHIIHANIDTDVIIAEAPSDAGSTKKPDDMYRIIEHFALGRRRLELFGEDHNIRSGWLTVGKGLSSSNFNAETYVRNFNDKDGKVWQGGGGRNPPPDAPHLVLTTPEIESLRPKSPPQKNQQQSAPIVSSGNRRPSGNSPQNPMNPSFHGTMNADLPGSEPATPAPWSSSPMVGFRGPDGELMGMDGYDGYGFNASFPQPFGDHIDIDPRRSINFL
ncbi:N6-adenosine-methyltransferase non-catalytic subunit MTB-like [Zingiber officinale]|uniref:N6-adenosine-methyltransferase non-catalytic subunit MTB-like n=1 Tax=Zingiber officinale TaxID=94328 RepID=UPI001C4BCCEF|nr:N6-adenosine-methyltransferase non-catalytic subunit MTB-like [Zingiber officinale]XP_042439565.1 N6-adenosine-methyltransferase non-catalytic subunit MTB-like [Zingiber officinale]